MACETVGESKSIGYNVESFVGGIFEMSIVLLCNLKKKNFFCFTFLGN